MGDKKYGKNSVRICRVFKRSEGDFSEHGDGVQTGPHEACPLSWRAGDPGGGADHGDKPEFLYASYGETEAD